MKRLAFALSLVTATAFAAPLAAQSRSQGPWYDPTNSGTRTTQDGRVVDRNGNIYNGGGVYSQADGQWRRYGKDRSGNTIYVRRRYDSQGNLIQEAATRNIIGQYRVVDRQVIQYARNSNGRYDQNGRYYPQGRDRNDRWDQNNGHDNGKHKGQYKNKHRDDDRRYDRRDDDHGRR